jgi:ribosomal protein L21E
MHSVAMFTNGNDQHREAHRGPGDNAVNVEAMNKFKVGDVVRIFKQPENQHVQLQGKTGVVDKVAESAIMFIELKLHNSCGGKGWVPNSCLEPVADPKWIMARDDRERRMKERISALDKAYKKRENAVAEARRRVGERFVLSGDQVKSIVSLYKKALREELEKVGLYDCQ